MSPVSLAPALTREEVLENFTDIKPPMTEREAILEASRCLYCFDAPCIRACPTGIEIPEFIKRIATGNLKGAARVILEANILGNSCGKVCPTAVLCEGACVYNNDDQKPIDIGRLQRYATDYVIDNDIPVLQAGPKGSGKKVGVIGGGPAGLSCAAELRKLGHDVTVYDANPVMGGLNTYGIAPYKLTVEECEAELAYLQKQLGMRLVTGKWVGKEIKLTELEKECDAIFLGIGLGKTRPLGIPGDDLPNVLGAIDFIRKLHEKPLHKVKVGRRVAVIGAGNTAIDAATEAARLGAERVHIVYRRGEADKSCHEFEYELAKQDGVIFHWWTAPVKILGEKQVTGLLCRRTKPSSRKGHPKGPGKPEIIPGSDLTLDIDMVVNATGQEKQEEWLSRIKGIVLKGGRVVVDPRTGQTGNKKYFAGGDCANGGLEVVNAVADGKLAARGIHEHLMKGRN